jgi:uncharacterized protein YecT (DUF1311 family)
VVRALALALGFAVATAGPPFIPIPAPSKTDLPCPRHGPQAGTTIGIEGCAIKDAIALERQINALVGPLYYRLDGPARERFVRAEHAWLHYRNATCASEADELEDGSGAGVVYAHCRVAQDRRHLADLRARTRAQGPH